MSGQAEWYQVGNDFLDRAVRISEQQVQGCARILHPDCHARGGNVAEEHAGSAGDDRAEHQTEVLLVRGVGEFDFELDFGF